MAWCTIPIKPHPEYSLEWWYQTGVLNDGDYSYELTVFRSKFSKGGWIVHAMVHDHVEDKRYFSETVLDPSEITLESNGEDFTLLYIGDITLYTVWKPSSIEIEFESKEFGFHLELKPRKGWVAHGENGIVDMALGKSYYYSLTNVDVTGWISIKGERHDITGKTWIDRQWGNFMPHPWDWFSFRLENGYELMVFGFPGLGYYGTVTFPDGTFEHVDNVRVDLKGEYAFDGKHIPIPQPGTVEIPDMKISLKAMAISKNQFNEAVHTPPYWEGLCRVEGTIGDEFVRGWAFFEGWR